MVDTLPPTIDATAVTRWHARKAQSRNLEAAWLHEEVGARMQERLDWIKRSPTSWADWGPVAGGLLAHQKVAARYPAASCYMAESSVDIAQAAIKKIANKWWKSMPWKAGKLVPGLPPEGGVQLLWSNMLLHSVADPQALIGQWQRALSADGFLMFSCLGPDTLKELHALYKTLGLGPCGHQFTDMHDWGDMLVGAGFAEPVMDMERIVLSFETPERALQELRGLGRNWHPKRFTALRGRAYLNRLHNALEHGRGENEGKSPPELAPSSSIGSPITLTFEVIYGHAFKAKPRIKVSVESAISMRDMREMLAQKPVDRGAS